MSIRELIELILDANGGDWEQTIDDINYLYSQIKLTPYALVKEMEEFALDNDRCPNCGNEMDYSTYVEDRGECQGIPVKEVMHKRYCPKCDYGGDE